MGPVDSEKRPKQGHLVFFSAVHREHHRVGTTRALLVFLLLLVLRHLDEVVHNDRDGQREHLNENKLAGVIECP